VRVGKVVNKYKVAKHFELTITDHSFKFSVLRKQLKLRDNVVKATFEQACQDVETNVNAGIEHCNREYADRWGVSEPKACRWAKAIVRQGIAEQQWRGQRKVLVRCRKGLCVLYGGAGHGHDQSKT